MCFSFRIQRRSLIRYNLAGFNKDKLGRCSLFHSQTWFYISPEVFVVFYKTVIHLIASYEVQLSWDLNLYWLEGKERDL